MSDRLAEVLDWIAATGTAEDRAKLARYGIPDDHAVGIPMGVMQKKAKALGRDHALALALWDTGGYEARTIAASIADPAALTVEMMEGWARDFDNWAITDTVCFRLFDQSDLAWDAIPRWAGSERLFTRRGAYALLWGLALHRKTAPDGQFEPGLDLIRAGDTLDEPLVEKAMLMALKAVGLRSDDLRTKALGVAEALIASGKRDQARIGRGARKAFA